MKILLTWIKAILYFSCLYLSAQVEDPYFAHWDTCKEPAITHRFFTHEHITPLLLQYAGHPYIEIQNIGQSFEKRDIYLIKIGTGEIPVLLWTQMHGDEPTATMAVLDIIRFFTQIDSLDTRKEAIREKLSIYIIPMLNPDGVAVNKRRNALDIDLNRDALALSSPESIILKQVRDSLQPHFGFNLHDQSNYYTPGDHNLPSSIAFLAPAYDEAKSLNNTRANAMRLIVQLNRLAQSHIPGQVGRFNDTFEPRAFGDNIQKWGTSTVLIESGYVHQDFHKQTQRQLHFSMLLHAFESIATQSYLYEGLKEYFDIPFNKLRAADLLIKNLSYPFKGEEPTLDLAFRKDLLLTSSRDAYFKAFINDMGDLSTTFGFEEIDAENRPFTAGKLLKGDWKKLHQMNISDILLDGYTHVLVRKLPDPIDAEKTPLQFILHEKDFQNKAAVGKNPSFFIGDPTEARWLIANGKAWLTADLPNQFSSITLKDIAP